MPVLIDRAQLEQVLVNLAVNARDAMPEGGTLSIAVTGPTAACGSRSPTTASGMPAEVRERAFEPFFTTKEAGEGTGLGLATRPRHRHATRAARSTSSSEVGGGTVVTDLPARRRAELAAPEEPARPAAAAAGDARCSSSRTRTRSAGRRGGSSRRTATRSTRRRARDEALADWAPVDVLVTDVVMPGMSGQQLAEHARELAPGLRIVFMSGHTDDVIVRDGARPGAIAFVQKPFTRDSLLRAVEDALQKPPPAGSNEASARPERPPPGRPRRCRGHPIG